MQRAPCWLHPAVPLRPTLCRLTRIVAWNTLRPRRSGGRLREGTCVSDSSRRSFLCSSFSAGSAFADFGYTVRLNQDGFFGEVDFSEESLLTTFATITDFDKNTLTAPDGNLAEYLVMSPVAGGPDCVLPFLSGSAACFGIHFAGGALASNALFGMLPDLNAPGTYGTPGSFFLTIHAAPEPPSWLLLLIGGVLLVCSRSGHGTRRQRLRHPA